MPNITGHTELVGLMAYPIRHTQSPTTHNLAYDKNGGCDGQGRLGGILDQKGRD